MRRASQAWGALACAALFACERTEPPGAAAQDAAAVDAGARAEIEASRPPYEPCALLPASALGAVFPDAVGKTFAPREPATKASLLDAVQERDARGFGIACRYGFPRRDARAVEARAESKRRALVMERIEARKRADGGALPRLSESMAAIEQPRIRVTLTMATKAPFASGADARAAFDARTAGRDGGAAAGLAGADDAAFDRGVLHVLSGPHLFAVEVAADPATDEARARSLAAHVLGALPKP